ncbi:hypothetical protein ACIBCN_05940 [Nocardia sp. NPDC051052]|uniref:LIC_13387 family protein n=1 Tax=Nocardia sp. NPDC051052 TaxID=3364322 RepID=UPI0037B8520D
MSTNRAYRIGAWCWIATGTVHTALDVIVDRLPKSFAENEIQDAMRSHTFDLPGLKRSYSDLLNGFSLGIGLLLILVGVLFLLLGRAAGQARVAALTGLVGSVVLLINAAALLPLPPIIMFSVASVAFGVALWAPGRNRALPTKRGVCLNEPRGTVLGVEGVNG